jgi:hypothetical protein
MFISQSCNTLAYLHVTTSLCNTGLQRYSPLHVYNGGREHCVLLSTRRDLLHVCKGSFLSVAAEMWFSRAVIVHGPGTKSVTSYQRLTNGCHVSPGADMGCLVRMSEVMWACMCYININVSRIWRSLMMTHNSRNYWVCGLCPSSEIINARKHNVSETGSVSFLRWGDTHSVWSLRKS